ncbi:hypothetical protein EOL96_03055 [Candidatus Saccharibacteria bacterium]|nr:hypothetical protein [Candidatus Saccharibacteria bacterium]
MNTEDIKLSLKRVFSDRTFLWMMSGLVAMGFMYILVVGLTIRASDVTVYSRYTAFGEGHFYKAHWQYLLTFLLFGLSVTLAHLALMIKLHNLEKRQSAFFIGILGIVILVVAMTYALSVMQLGRVV